VSETQHYAPKSSKKTKLNCAVASRLHDAGRERSVRSRLVPLLVLQANPLLLPVLPRRLLLEATSMRAVRGLLPRFR
jgi:hypothetical protein